MPEEGGLGAHLTLDLAGQAKFGPDVEWVDSIDYRVHSERAEGFYHTIRRYWPTLPDGALQPSYSGAHAHAVLEGQGALLAEDTTVLLTSPRLATTLLPGCIQRLLLYLRVS